MTEILPWIFAILAAFGGLGLGWHLGGRGLAEARRERDGMAERFNAAIRDLAGAVERAKQAGDLQARLDVAVAEREDARRELAALKSQSVERERALGEQLAQLQRMKEQLSVEFSNLAQKVMAEAQGQFLKRADERFHQAGEKSEAQLRALLQPVETTLKQYQEGLQRVEKERTESYAGLREAVEQVRFGQSQVREETAKLINALRAAPKTRGRWGEQQFKNLIEMAGLSSFVDFREEVSVEADGALLRPDFVIRLPGDQQLVVDVKCSLEAYLQAVEQSDPEPRERFLTDHARAVRTHADALGRKAYWEQFEKAPDFVIMYVPGDNFITAALEADMELWERAAKNRVIICGPATFLPLARTLASHWRQAKMQDEAKQIGQLGKEMYERLVVAAGHLKKLGNGLNSAVNHYNSFVSSLEGRVLVTGRKFRDLNIETGSREIEMVEGVDLLAREPQVEALPGPAE